MTFATAWEIGVRVVAGLAMMALAVGVALYIRRVVYTKSWKPYRAGAACFVLSQVVHIPLNLFLLTPAFRAMNWDLTAAHGSTLLAMGLALGLLAGLCEETTRYIYYRWYCHSYARQETHNEAPDYSFALMLGAGHGGCEAILAGYVALMTVVGMAFLEAHPEQIPNEQHDAVVKAITEYWAETTGQVLMGPVERIFAMTFHLAASVLVWQAALLQRQDRENGHQSSGPAWPWFYYYGMAVIFHTLLDAAAVYFLLTWGVYAVELCLAVTAFPLSLYILWYYYQRSGVRFAVLPSLQQDSQPQEDMTLLASAASSEPSMVNHDTNYEDRTCSESDP